MGRTPKGKPLTLRPVRLDDDVWAECQRLGKEHGTMNEGLRAALQITNDGPVTVQTSQGAVVLGRGDRVTQKPDGIEVERAAITIPVADTAPDPSVANGRAERPVSSWKRGPRQKGDKSR